MKSYLRTEQYIKVNGLDSKSTATESRFGQMELDTRAFGYITRLREEENSGM